MGDPVRLLRLFLVRPRRVLRRRHVHDREPRDQPVGAARLEPARLRHRRGAAGARRRRRRLPRAPIARRAVRAADAGGHLRAGDDRTQHAARRRARHLPARLGGAEAVRQRHLDDLSAGPRDRRGVAGDGVGGAVFAARPRALCGRRRRGRGRSARRADLPLQAGGARPVLLPRRHRRRHPRGVRRLRDGGGDVLDHGPAVRGADERAGRRPALVRPGDRRRPRHRADAMPSSAATGRCSAGR